ncbi:flavodoxin [Bacteroidales bacterium SW292]|uniref:Flavodoxin n=3 Tax=Bacteroidaceae TaxID=815 RepID=F0R1K4_PHOSB|nr:flavodoxin [Phocaeicola salanitronis]ADY35327.1 flavodoxin [Phocaeicola salanitronis DSM 18170]MBU3814156.1 NAD(P)H-dependent oxidoreductase [Candidatus Bacteroides intestinipullorum]MBW9203091.1 flavodoxin [Bacteroidales bacterium SW292]
MKHIYSFIAILLVGLLPITSCAQTNQRKEQNMKEKKILVAFFSRAGENYAVGHIEKGNTHIIAEMIAAETDGDLFHIEPVTPYPDDYTECTEVAKQELNVKARPAIKGDIKVEDYDIIFIGYPNWWGDMPMPVYTFIEKHSWQGKTVIPFCTHEGSGLSGTENKLKAACKGATVLKGLAVRGATAQNAQAQAKESVNNWLGKLKY